MIAAMQLCEVASRIKDVVVYRRGARVTRRAEVTLQRCSGSLGLRFEELPLALDTRSVRARLHAAGDHGWKVVDVQPALEESKTREDIRLQLREARAEVEWLSQLCEKLRALELRPRRGDAAELPIDSRLALLSFQRESLTTVDEDLARTRHDLKRLEEASVPRCGLAAVLTLEQGRQDVQAIVELDYFVPGPCWAPAYVGRLSERLDRCALTMQALVAQDTGEEWAGVNLTVTTAEPPTFAPEAALRVRADLTPSWRLPSQDPEPLFADFDRALGAPATDDDEESEQHLRPSLPPLLYGSEGQSGPTHLRPMSHYLDYPRLRLAPASHNKRGRLEPAQPMVFQGHEVVTAAVASSQATSLRPLPDRARRPRSHHGFDFAYVSEYPADVPSDGAFVACAIYERDLGCSPRYVAVPRESTDVYRSTELHQDGPGPLLEGPIDLYLADNYAMTTSLPYVEEGGRTRLELGTEPHIEVVRKTHFVEVGGRLIRAPKEMRHGIRIEVVNHLDHRVTVEVRERIPVPERERGEVKVSIDRVSPPWGRFAPDRTDLPGRYRWRERVDSDDRVLLSVDYTVKLPMRAWLIGGDRREFS